MDIRVSIKNRRTVRKYKTKKIPGKTLKKLLDSARWAPSLHNAQPWKFIIVEGGMKEKLVRALEKKTGKEFLMVRLLLKDGIETIKKAPVAILAYNNGLMSSRSRMGGRAYFKSAETGEMQSVACAIQNILLTAHSLGLGAAWLGIPLFREKAINKLFRADGRLMAILTVGYPGEKPKAPRRKPVSEIASFIK